MPRRAVRFFAENVAENLFEHNHPSCLRISRAREGTCMFGRLSSSRVNAVAHPRGKCSPHASIPYTRVSKTLPNLLSRGETTLRNVSHCLVTWG